MDLEDRKRPEGRNAILVYGYSKEGVQSLRTIMAEAGIDELIYIEQADCNQRIKEIITDKEADAVSSYHEHDDKVIIFNSTSQYEVNAFITKLFKDVDVRPIVAMVTPTSKKWQFSELVEELKREKEALK
jgi:hypothetical protein